MSLNKSLDRLFDEIRREAKRNPDFADRLDAVLRVHEAERVDRVGCRLACFPILRLLLLDQPDLTLFHGLGVVLHDESACGVLQAVLRADGLPVGRAETSAVGPRLAPVVGQALQQTLALDDVLGEPHLGHAGQVVRHRAPHLLLGAAPFQPPPLLVRLAGRG